MRSILLPMLALSLAVCLTQSAPAQMKEGKGAPEGTAARPSTAADMNEVELWSYAVGMNVGNKLRYAKDILDTDALVLGILDVLYGEPLISQEKSFLLRQEFNEARLQATDRERAAEGAKNAELGRTFLVENMKKPGVITTESGLQYEVLAEGQGPTPDLLDEVVVSCRKMYVDGTEFESSDNFGKPYVFRVDTAIAGWQEGLRMMKVGSKYRLYIPPELGYGPVGMGWLIGPYATLIYETELLEIHKHAGGE